MHRIGWSVQVPARQAEQDDAAVAAWEKEDWPVIKDGLSWRAAARPIEVGPVRLISLRRVVRAAQFCRTG